MLKHEVSSFDDIFNKYGHYISKMRIKIKDFKFEDNKLYINDELVTYSHKNNNIDFVSISVVLYRSNGYRRRGGFTRHHYYANVDVNYGLNGLFEHAPLFYVCELKESIMVQKINEYLKENFNLNSFDEPTKDFNIEVFKTVEKLEQNKFKKIIDFKVMEEAKETFEIYSKDMLIKSLEKLVEHGYIELSKSKNDYNMLKTTELGRNRLNKIKG